jgi:DNA polymerase III delta prime subunit
MYHVSSVLAAGDASIIPEILKRDGIPENSPDVLVREYRSFGIEDAQEIRARALTRPVAGDRRYFILSVPSMTTEAQNALLKTIEEPKGNAVFYFVTPSPNALLPTIQSRSEKRVYQSEGKSDALVDADDFLAATPEKRIMMLKPLYDHEDEGRDIGAVIAFLQSLERRFAKEKPSMERSAGIKAIYRARKYATDKGSLLKALLEQVALLAPKM